VSGEKISAPKILRFLLPIDRPTPLYKTLVLGPNNEKITTAFVADICADGSWLKELHITHIKSPKVICRAVHDATLNNTTRELKNSVVLLYFFITDSNC